MKNVLIVNSTFRKGGNSNMLADQFQKGAEEAGNAVQRINLRDLDLKFCTGCLYCQSHDNCVLNDGMNELYGMFQNADVLVFATPVYYYAVCGQLKTFLDRLNPLYPRNNSFTDVYLLAASADDDERAMDGAVKDVQGWVDCFDGVTLRGVIRGVGVTEKGEINGTRFPQLAYEMGKSIS